MKNSVISRILPLLLLGVLFGNPLYQSFAQGSTYWYVNNLPDVWFYQPDVFAFRCINGQAFTATFDSTLVDSIIHHSDRRDAAVEVYFKPTATPADRISEIQNIFASGQVEMPYITVTRDPLRPYEEDEWFVIDNLLIVTFKQAYPAQADIDAFMNRYNLTLFSAPSPALPLKTDNVSYSYVFEVSLPTTTASVQTGGVSFDYFLELARGMFIVDAAFVNSAEPNIVNGIGGREIETHTDYSSVANPSAQYNCPSNDPLYIQMNHIENIGTNVPGSSIPGSGSVPNGTSGADAHICGCWSQGLSGAGVNVGVLGAYDICLSSGDDMDGAYNTSKLWDCSNGPCHPATTNCPNITPGFSLTRMAGLVAERGNNGLVGIGVAPNSSIFAYQIGYSTVSFMQGLQQALTDQPHIIVTDYFTPVLSQSVESELANHVRYGRNGKGTVVIAPAGYKEYVAAGMTNNYYPAAMTVPVNDGAYPPISVIGSDRFDHLCTREHFPGTGVGYTYASNYGIQYDVAAPGASVPVLHGFNGYINNYTSYAFPHSSAVATVAGIAALILEHTPTLFSWEVRQAVIDGADKVGGYTYTSWGKSAELGFGRVNCGQSIASIYTSVLPAPSVAPLSVQQHGEAWQVLFSVPVQEHLTLTVFSVNGQIVQKTYLNTGETETMIPAQHLCAGIYFISVSTHSGEILTTTKASLN